MNKLNFTKKQLLSAACLLALGGTAARASEHYQINYRAETEPETAAVLAPVPDAAVRVQPLAAEVNTDDENEAAGTGGFVPHVVQLNLAYRYPEGADETDPLNSKAGIIFKKLMEKDEAWMSNLFDLSDTSPEKMASRLGRSRQSVMGKYNFKDDKHDPGNPDTWTINSFKKVHMQYLNGDGGVSNGFSNVVPIMSMASVYTWFQDLEDDEAFLDYAMRLWNDSHDYSISIGDVYYCKGCLSKDGEQLELEALLAEDAMERAAAVAGAVSGFQLSPSQSGGTAAEAQTETAAVKGPGAFLETYPETLPDSQTADLDETGSDAPAPESAAEALRQDAGMDSSQAEASVLAIADTPAPAAAETALASAAEHISEPEAPLATASDAAEHPEETEAAGKRLKEENKCPGHVDLYIKAKVIGVNEKKNLFAIDSAGNNDKNKSGDGWEGWNTYTKSYATRMSGQDWYERYGLSVSFFSVRNPLTAFEIEEYMNELPSYLSEEKKKMIHYALSSVGKVPYYWGGKAASKSYDGNSFGVIVAPDENGRILRGLDCSGWIGWVYWSSTGKRLPYESTSGLAAYGTPIGRSQLEPGDIVLRTGDNAHVIMFLGWTEDGKIRCVQETSGSVNNVTISDREANWPYYRRLID